MKRTKIVCTIGPSCREPEMLEKMILAGMDVARLNMSHAEHDTHADNIARVRAASEKTGKPIGVLIDLQGPKLRIGQMPPSGILIHGEETIKLTTADIEGREIEGRARVEIPLQYKKLPEDVKQGERILLNDGLIEIEVQDVENGDIYCRVITGGILTSNKGLNLPGTDLSVSAITDKDWADLDFAIEQRADWVALSFVRTAAEVNQLRQRILERCHDPNPARVIAKIEKPQALDFIDEIIKAADGIMVARGDMGVEIPPESVPLVQKRLIQLCNAAGKPVITATQMLDSMIRNPRPTRAEASDVANAILDGTDAIMLSGETADGQYPLEAVETMTRISEQVENATMFGQWKPPEHVHKSRGGDVTDAVAHATCTTAFDLRAKAIITSTASGKTARAVCKYRPHTPIIAVTPDSATMHQLTLSWGVIPLPGSPSTSIGEVIRDAIDQAAGSGLVREGQRVVVTAGVATNMPGATNLMRVEQVRTYEEANPSSSEG